MKRYRVLSYAFDSRATLLKEYQRKDIFKGEGKEQLIKNLSGIKDGLVSQYGAQDHEKK